MTSTTQRRQPLILVAEDDELVSKLIVQVLEESGYQVAEAGNGREAIELFQELMPDLVLLDVLMPELDGFGACKGIRALETSRHTPIIIMTALDDVESINDAFEAGATDFITKPVIWPLFAQRVRYALRGSQIAIELHDNQYRLEEAQRIANMGHYEIDLTTQKLACSNQLVEILGLQHEDMAPDLESLLTFVHPDDGHAIREAIDSLIQGGEPLNMDFKVNRLDGSVGFACTRAELVRDRNKQPVRLVGIWHDVTERKAAEQRIHYLSYYDELTELANRTLFNDRLQQTLFEAARYNHLVGVMIIDLDRFKKINDSLGNDVGDQLLKEVANRLQPTMRKCDTLARLGDDEFGIMLGKMSAPQDAAKVAQRVLDSLRTPFYFVDEELFMTPSIGIAISPLDSNNIETLLKNANSAVFQAKETGRNNFQFYTSNMNAMAKERLSMESRLRRALDNNEFLLCFQPQIIIETGDLCGVEALLRWEDGKNGLTPPDEFIPMLEDTGLIIAVGEWVLRTACEQILEWQRCGYELNISVNLSPRQFNDPNLIDSVLKVIQETGIDPERLELELTESTLIESEAKAIETLTALKSTGIKLAIDDFGTGYSSLAYLKKLPLDYLKVDRSFVLNMKNDEDDRTIVSSTIDLAHNLGLKVIAEGIEDVQSLTLLKEMRCEIAQGFYIGRPLHPSQFQAWLTGYQAVGTR